MHTQPMQDSDGDFSKEHKSEGTCHKCKTKNLVYEIWESHCGGYEDYKYTCKFCNYYFWVDGIDS